MRFSCWDQMNQTLLWMGIWKLSQWLKVILQGSRQLGTQTLGNLLDSRTQGEVEMLLLQSGPKSVFVKIDVCPGSVGHGRAHLERGRELDFLGKSL